MKDKSLDSIISNFDPTEVVGGSPLRSGGPVTIWLPREYKDRYDQLQITTGRRFCKKVRELIQAAIEVTEERAAS